MMDWGTVDVPSHDPNNDLLPAQRTAQGRPSMPQSTAGTVSEREGQYMRQPVASSSRSSLSATMPTTATTATATAKPISLLAPSAIPSAPSSLSRYPSQKRHVSAPMSISPRSPLAGSSSIDSFQSPLSASASSSSSRRHSGHYSLNLSPPSPNSSSNKPHRRRRSSAGSLATPYGSFVGSYENSLLSGRMSAAPSKPLQFMSSLGVLGAEGTPSKLKCPKHLNLAFDAMYYEEGPASSCPYVGTIDLEAHYLGVMSDSDAEWSSAPRFPGYRVPVQGQVQLVIKNPNSTAIKLFLIPYDLNGLNRDGQGGKTFLQQKSYSVAQHKLDEKGKLRFAVHLQFCSPPSDLSKSDRPREPTYYLHQTIRVVFASRALDMEEKLRVVNDSPAHDKVIDRFSAYTGPPLEFEILRKKLREREKVRRLLAAEAEQQQLRQELEQAAATAAQESSPPHHDPNLLPQSYEPSTYERPLLSTPPASDLDSMSMSSLGSALPEDANHAQENSSGEGVQWSSRGRSRPPSASSRHHRGNNLSITSMPAFDDETKTALPSPVLQFPKQMRRESSGRSALSQSRPGSRNE